MMHGFMRERSHAPEKMDDPGCDSTLLINTVRQFRLINFLFSASRALLKRHFVPLMNPGAPNTYTLLDIGAGGCDTAVWFMKYCRRNGIGLRVTCLDSDPRIVAYSRDMTMDIPEVEIVHLSAFELERIGDYDFVFTNHFMHHLDDEDLTRLLGLVAGKTRIRFLMNDLRRSLWSYIGFRLFAALFLHRSFAGYDGSLSILRGFTPAELNELVEHAEARHRLRTGTAFPGRIYILGEGKPA
jgi:2-polyprenyl-3-methyl-5-hydroxy-6-metoxy-1,4-benzoquinol methylase